MCSVVCLLKKAGVCHGFSSPRARLVDGCIVRPVVAREDSPVPLRSRVVQGFGSERCDDVAADRARLDAEQLARQIHRVQEGERGRMTDRTGEDLDRSAGSAWKAGGRLLVPSRDTQR